MLIRMSRGIPYQQQQLLLTGRRIGCTEAVGGGRKKSRNKVGKTTAQELGILAETCGALESCSERCRSPASQTPWDGVGNYSVVTICRGKQLNTLQEKRRAGQQAARVRAQIGSCENLQPAPAGLTVLSWLPGLGRLVPSHQIASISWPTSDAAIMGHGGSCLPTCIIAHLLLSSWGPGWSARRSPSARVRRSTEAFSAPARKAKLSWV